MRRNKFRAVRTNGLDEGLLIYGGDYFVTVTGEVYSLTFRNRMISKPRGEPRRIGSITKGYWIATLCVDGEPIAKRVSVLMLETFVGPRPKGMHAGHRDGNSLNNNLDNLAWITPKENQEDRRRHGRRQVGSEVKSSKLTESKVREIFGRKKKGEGTGELAREFGITREAIYSICNGKNWAHLELLNEKK